MNIPRRPAADNFGSPTETSTEAPVSTRKRRGSTVEINRDLHERLKAGSATRGATLESHVECLIEFALSDSPFIKHLREEHLRNIDLLNQHLEVLAIQRRANSPTRAQTRAAPLTDTTVN